MEILVCDTKAIHTVQQQFNEAFPHLKIEFFTRKHKPGQASDIKNSIEHNRLLSECRTKHNTDKIEILPTMSVAQLEQKFWDGFGLAIQVFRMGGNDWVETIATDGWTLAKQEETAKMHETNLN